MHPAQKKSSETQARHPQLKRPVTVPYGFKSGAAQSKNAGVGVPAGRSLESPAKPPVAQQKSRGLSPTSKMPSVYRPQPVPHCLQMKAATVHKPQTGQLEQKPTAPPVYRPQSIPKVLQTKKAIVSQSDSAQRDRHPSQPGVLRPQQTPKGISSREPTIQMRAAGVRSPATSEQQFNAQSKYAGQRSVPQKNEQPRFRIASTRTNPHSHTIQRSASAAAEFPPLSSVPVRVTKREAKDLRADAATVSVMNKPETWWELFGLGESHAEAQTVGIDNYGSHGGYRIHVTLYKVNSHNCFFLGLTEDQIINELLGNETEARAFKGIHVTWERTSNPKQNPKCFRGGVTLRVGGDASLKTALEQSLDHFLTNARAIIRQKKQEHEARRAPAAAAAVPVIVPPLNINYGAPPPAREAAQNVHIPPGAYARIWALNDAEDNEDADDDDADF